MSMRSKFLLLSLTALSLSSCNSSSGSGEKPPLNSEFECIPESYLQGIVGGETVSKYSSDANRVVMLLSGSGDKIELCTAAPIAQDVLLTAAHCITSTAAETKAFVTTSATCESGFQRTKQGIQARAVVVHEGYRDLDTRRLSDIKSDLALVFLSGKLPTSQPIYKIADSTRSAEFGSLFLYGYGAVSMTKKSSGILRKTEVSSSAYKIETDLKEISINQTYGRGVCSGDSGGPGLVMLDGEMQILGVNSYVSGPRGSTDYCQYEGNLALADYYTDWIDNKMMQYGRTRKK